jgi:hypothetical protein
MSVPILFSYAGTDLNADMAGDFYWEIIGSLFDGLTTKGTSSTAPSHDGMFARPRRHLRRAIPLRGHIIGDTPTEFYSILAAQVALFDLKGHGDFVAVIPGLGTYTLDVRPLNWITNFLMADISARPTVDLESYEGADWVIVP